MKTKLTPAQRQFCVQTLRRASFKWKARSAALKAARISRGVYRCAACGGKTGPKGGNMDHVLPVVDPQKGFVNLDIWASRLLAEEDGWQWLCIECHNQKTLEEMSTRNQNHDFFKKPAIKRIKKTIKKKAVTKKTVTKKKTKKKATKSRKGKK